MSVVDNIILTSKNSSKADEKNVYYAQSPAKAIEVAERKDHSTVLLIGGGTTNGLFLKKGLINEIFLSVHPLILGDGIRLFGEIEADINLEFVDQKEFGWGLVQLHYRVLTNK